MFGELVHEYWDFSFDTLISRTLAKRCPFESILNIYIFFFIHLFFFKESLFSVFVFKAEVPQKALTAEAKAPLPLQ